METGSRIPPHSLETEQALLGSVLLDSEALEHCQHLTREAFYKPAHQYLWDAILNISRVGDVLDLVTLKVELERTGKLENAGGMSYFLGLSDAVPTALNAEIYTRILEEKYTLRQLISRSGQMMSAAYEAQGSLEDLLEQASRIVQNLEHGGLDSETLTQFALTRTFLYEIESGNAPLALSTSLEDLDSVLDGGLEGGKLYVLAARPSMGKSAMMMQWAHRLAQSGRGTVAIFSLEMSAMEISDRLICMLSGVSAGDIKAAKRGIRRLSAPLLKNVTRETATLETLPIQYFDNSSLTLAQLARELRTLAAREGLCALFVDYLQLINLPGVTDEVKRLSDISRMLKQLARELNIPVVALSQLSRGVESRPEKRPLMSDLRGSGSLEQDADVILMLYREAYYNKALSVAETKKETETAEVLVLKNRGGSTRAVEMVWEPGRVRFLNKEVAIISSTLQTPDTYFDSNARGEA